MLLVRKGAVLAANPAADLIFAPVAPTGAPLAELLADAPEATREYLRFASRTFDLVPGSLRVHTAKGVEAYCAEGCRLPPLDGGIVLIRLRPKVERVHSFVVLNQKIDALTH